MTHPAFCIIREERGMMQTGRGMSQPEGGMCDEASPMSHQRSRMMQKSSSASREPSFVPRTHSWEAREHSFLCHEHSLVCREHFLEPRKRSRMTREPGGMCGDRWAAPEIGTPGFQRRCAGAGRRSREAGNGPVMSGMSHGYVRNVSSRVHYERANEKGRPVPRTAFTVQAGKPA
jgi:hypothetical protein